MCFSHSGGERWVTMSKGIHPEVTCKMKFEKYPFDDGSECNFIVSLMTKNGSIKSIYSNGADVGFWISQYGNTVLEYDFEFRSLGFKAIPILPPGIPESFKQMIVSFGWDERTAIPCAGFKMTLKRQSTRFIFLYYLPSSLFVVCSWVSFLVPPLVSLKLLLQSLPFSWPPFWDTLQEPNTPFRIYKCSYLFI